MKINRIAANPYAKMAVNTKSNQKDSKKSEQLSFEGYKKNEPFGPERMGFRPSTHRYSNLEKVTTLCSYKPYGGYCSYVADVDEHPDLDALKKDGVDFVIEYAKPDDIKFSDFANAILDAHPEELDFRDVVDYVRLQKEDKQEEFDHIKYQLRKAYKTFPDCDKLNKQLKETEVALYYLGEKLDAYDGLQKLADKVESSKKDGTLTQGKLVHTVRTAESIYERHLADLYDDYEDYEDFI